MYYVKRAEVSVDGRGHLALKTRLDSSLCVCAQVAALHFCGATSDDAPSLSRFVDEMWLTFPRLDFPPMQLKHVARFRDSVPPENLVFEGVRPVATRPVPPQELRSIPDGGVTIYLPLEILFPQGLFVPSDGADLILQYRGKDAPKIDYPVLFVDMAPRQIDPASPPGLKHAVFLYVVDKETDAYQERFSKDDPTLFDTWVQQGMVACFSNVGVIQTGYVATLSHRGTSLPDEYFMDVAGDDVLVYNTRFAPHNGFLRIKYAHPVPASPLPILTCLCVNLVCFDGPLYAPKFTCAT